MKVWQKASSTQDDNLGNLLDVNAALGFVFWHGTDDAIVGALIHDHFLAKANLDFVSAILAARIVFFN